MPSNYILLPKIILQLNVPVSRSVPFINTKIWLWWLWDVRFRYRWLLLQHKFSFFLRTVREWNSLTPIHRWSLFPHTAK